MSTEITTTRSFLPDPANLEEAWKICQILAESDMVPKDFKGKPGNCMIAMQWGTDLGIPGIQALQNIAVINGRPSIWGDAAKALVIGRSDCEDIKEFFEGEGDKITAVCTVKRKGKSPVTSRFGLADAKMAGLLGKQGPWTQYRNRMLQMRARGFALRDAFPDALRGLSIAEEAQDLATEKEINPGTDTKSKEGDVSGKLNMSKFNKKPVSDATIYVDLETVLAAIEAINSKETQEAAKNLVAQLSPENIKAGKEEYKKRCALLTEKALKAKKSSESPSEIDWKLLIAQCKTIAEINELCTDMPEQVLIDLNDEIDGAKFEIEMGA